MILSRLFNRSTAEYDREIVKQFVEIFPSSPVSASLKGYFSYMNISLFDVDDNAEDVLLSKPEEEDPFDMILVSQMTLDLSALTTGPITERICINSKF